MYRTQPKEKPRVRTPYPTSYQKRRLIQLVSMHPEVTAKSGGKPTAECSLRDYQRIWQTIANDCNSLPPPATRKTWIQWRKTFQDLKAKYKRWQKSRDLLPRLQEVVAGFNKQERQVLGIQMMPSSNPEFVNLDGENVEIYLEEENQDSESAETKVFMPKKKKIKVQDETEIGSDNEPAECLLDFDTLAAQEEHKTKIKEDYYNFKKEYYQQKLRIMQEQTEALHSIARNLAK